MSSEPTIKDALTNYISDLLYNRQHRGREALNASTCGTPCFDSDGEMDAYIDKITRLKNSVYLSEVDN